jgi:hypothetical protein
VWNTSSFVILTAAYSIQPYFVHVLHVDNDGSSQLLVTAGVRSSAKS